MEKTTEEIAKEMADTLLHVSVYFRLEGWERDLTDEELTIATKIENALDNQFGNAARKTVTDAIARDTQAALERMADRRAA